MPGLRAVLLAALALSGCERRPDRTPTAPPMDLEASPEVGDAGLPTSRPDRRIETH